MEWNDRLGTRDTVIPKHLSSPLSFPRGAGGHASARGTSLNSQRGLWC